MVVTDIEANGKDLQGAVASAEINGTKWAPGPKSTRRRPNAEGGWVLGLEYRPWNTKEQG